ncbi:MAG: rRNA pseudouridine synthase [Chloroflexi bacterium]|nr:rRNA pseudouridine synthase [Chloroflexota bacterium]
MGKSRGPFRYILVHKPAGVLGDYPDPAGRQTVRDLVPLPGKLFPVGRLDARTEGLVLLTDDGKLAHYLTHPRYGFEREYVALVEGKPSEDVLRRLEEGVPLKDGLARAQHAAIIGEGTHDTTWLRLILTEGKKREVRRMLAAVGHPVRRLIRVRFGPLTLDDLEPGRWRFLRKEEVRQVWQEIRRRLSPRRRSSSNVRT